METDVVVPVPSPPVEFNFDSNCSSPYITAPSSPQRIAGAFFFSAPTSPSRRESAGDGNPAGNSASAVPFDWEEKPGTPKMIDEDEEEDFAFDFSGHLDRASLSADELFDGGKIRPLKPPSGSGLDSSVSSSVSSPRSPKTRFSQKKVFDPFVAALEETRRRGEALAEPHQRKDHEHQRGRERNSSSSSSSFVHKGSRSLSPMRVSDIILETEDDLQKPSPRYGFLSLFFSNSLSKGNRKWRLRDLLFRSASEGRVTGKDALGKYAVLSRKTTAEDVKNSSFRSTDSSVGSRRVSAHELHYTANRAVTEEMKKKTFLPYKQGLLGCLGFNPGVHEISRGIGSMTRG